MINDMPLNIGMKERLTPTHVYFLRGPLSQWFHSPFFACDYLSHVMGYASEFHRFDTCEHYMMYNKAMLMRDLDVAQEILKTPHPRDVKALGREVKNFDFKLWEAARFDVVIQANIFKFASLSADPRLYNYLKMSEQRIIVEANPQDAIWGVALSETDDAILDEKNWKGLNLLGKALMVARDPVELTKPEYRDRVEKLKTEVFAPLVDKWRKR